MSANVKRSIVNFISFEGATSIIYPWAISPEIIIQDYLEKIEKECNGHDDTDTIYDAIDKICGVNPVVSK